MRYRMLFFVVLSLSTVVNADNLPAIYIERVANDNGTLAAALKLRYDQCVHNKELVARLEREQVNNPIAWEAAKENYEKEILAHAKTPAAPEPKWDELKQKRVEEFFDQEKFSRKTYHTHYAIDVAICRLQEREDLTLQIDDGQKYITIEFREKQPTAATMGAKVSLTSQYKSYKVKQKPSARVNRARLRADRDGLRNTPAAVDALGEAASLPRDHAPGEQVRPMPGLAELDVLKKAFGFKQEDYKEPHYGDGNPPRQGGELIIAGQACDMTHLNSLGGKVCFWHRMHRYPDQYGAKVLLMKEVKLGGRMLTETATTFKTMDNIDPAVFKMPAGIRLR